MGGSGVADEVLAIRKQLEKITADGEEGDMERALDLLRELEKLNINLDVLTTTRIGMTVNSLRKSSNDDGVISLAKSLIKTWKKFVPDTADKKEKKKDEKRSESSSNGDKKLDTSANSGSSGLDSGGSPTSIGGKSFPARPLPTTDEVRLRCREMLSGALRGDGEMPDGVYKPVEEIAEIVEDTIYKKMRDTGMRYKNQIRSRVFNLRDKKNPALRENVLCGVIQADKFAVMTAEEMASDDVKQQRQAYVKEGIDAAQLAKVEGTKTDLLKCGKCGKSNCTYNQIQTRSADEPMTTFVLCNECGNRWKFC